MRERRLFDADQQLPLGPRVPEPEPMARRRIRATVSARGPRRCDGLLGSEEPYEPYTSAPRVVAMHVSSANSVVTHSRTWLPGSSHG